MYPWTDKESHLVAVIFLHQINYTFTILFRTVKRCWILDAVSFQQKMRNRIRIFFLQWCQPFSGSSKATSALRLGCKFNEIFQRLSIVSAQWIKYVDKYGKTYLWKWKCLSFQGKWKRWNRVYLCLLLFERGITEKSSLVTILSESIWQKVKLLILQSEVTQRFYHSNNWL